MKIICVGRNYAAHISELNNEKPANPVIFIKPDSAVLPRQQDFYIPDFSNNVHHEVEVVVRIDKVGKYVDQRFAHKYYSQIGLGIDFTARDLQDELKEKGLPWEKAKAFDGAAVVGDFFSKEEIGDVDNISFSLSKNGVIVQEGNTSLMLWKIDEIIAYVSRFFTLKKGDLIYTGTPAGVGKVTAEDVLVGTINNKQAFKVTIK